MPAPIIFASGKYISATSTSFSCYGRLGNTEFRTENKQGEVVQNIPDARCDYDDSDRLSDMLFSLKNGFNDDFLHIIAEEIEQRNHNNKRQIGV